MVGCDDDRCESDADDWLIQVIVMRWMTRDVFEQYLQTFHIQTLSGGGKENLGGNGTLEASLPGKGGKVKVDAGTARGSVHDEVGKIGFGNG